MENCHTPSKQYVGAFEHGVLGENVAPLPKNIVPLALQVAAMQRDSLNYIKMSRHKTKR
jgi:UDP-glucose 4-epimerase